MVIAVIGGGAAGMMAALTASQQPEHEIWLLERQTRMGRKLLATGNGRCNLSNYNLSRENYHGMEPEFSDYALEHFDVSDTLDWFRQLGLFTVCEASGRIYPFSDSANSVVDVLRLALEQRPNVHILCGVEVTRIRKGKSFTVHTQDHTVKADRVIVTAGGCAGSKLGGTMSGYQLLQEFGHSCTKLYPSLVQLKTDPTYPRSLKGVRAEAIVTLLGGGRILAQQQGEVQFTEFGVSGPAVFALSRYASPPRSDMAVQLNLMPEASFPDLNEYLTQRRQQFGALTAENLLTGMLHNRLGRTVLRYAGYSLTQTIDSLQPADLRTIAQAIQTMCLPVTGLMGMDAAQVTAGGIRTEEFDPQTMESRLVPGLYAAGEVLDIDGDCGGYNLQWAWSSGHLAGLLRTRSESA